LSQTRHRETKVEYAGGRSTHARLLPLCQTLPQRPDGGAQMLTGNVLCLACRGV
jgi:hypothetical protein